MTGAAGLSWIGILRLGVAQMALGAMAVVATSTLNRIMVVELALPAIVPGLLVGLHYALQVMRPRWGDASDQTARPDRLVIGGMALLAAGLVIASLAIALMGASRPAGIALAVLGYAVIGLGVAGAGTSLLAILAAGVAGKRRPAAATIAWLMMIFGGAATAIAASAALQDFSIRRLAVFTAAVAAACLGAASLAVWRLAPRLAAPSIAPGSFAARLRAVWAERRMRSFAVFIFVSMLAYSGQELILEPFAGFVFHLSPAGTAALLGLQQAGVLAGMLLAAIGGTAIGGRVLGSMRLWTMNGCLLSALALIGLALCGLAGPAGALRPLLFVLGIANGAFTVGAIGSMMQMAAGAARGPGLGMGVFGAAQAIAFGCGGIVSSSASDVARRVTGAPVDAYALVFALEAILFLAAAVLAARIFTREATPPAPGAAHQVGSLS